MDHLDNEVFEPKLGIALPARRHWPSYLRPAAILRWPRVVQLTLAVFFAILGSYFIVLLTVQDEWTRLVFSDVISPISIVLVCVAALYAAVQSRGDKRLHHAWWLIFAASVSNAIGETIWSIQEIGLQDQLFPSLADLFYLAYFPIMIVGILVLPRPKLSSNEKLKMILDLGIILLGGWLAYWNFLIGPLMFASGDDVPWFHTLISLAYPVFDLALLYVLFGALVGLLGRYNRWPVALLGLGLFSQIVADSIYSYQAVIETFSSGGLLDAGWLFAYGCIALAGIIQGISPTTSPSEDGFDELRGLLGDVQTYLPYIWLALGFFTLMTSFYRPLPMSTFGLAVGMGAMITLVLARQVTSFIENSRLTRQLQSELEERKRIASNLKYQRELFKKLVDVARETTSATSLNECLENIIRVSLEIAKAERGSLFIFNEQGEITNCVLARGNVIREDMIIVREVMEKGLAGWVYRNQKPALIDDVEQDKRWLHLDNGNYVVRSAMSAPIMLGNTTLGVLTMHHPQVAYFTQEQVQFILAAAQQMALALHNAQILEEQLRLAAELKIARDAADDLLLDILPAPIAERLKAGELVIADSFTDVSVMFADLVDFTPFAGTVTPAELVTTLNLIFSRFDDLVEKYGVEKIKTSGDAYIVVGGLNLSHENHARALADTALEMVRVVEELHANSGIIFRLRVGIHTGPVVAGVIGKKKFSYDLWGDTVNIASRMESQGVTGSIQVTQAIHDLLGDGYIFEERGWISVKGKGDMPVYLLVGKDQQRHSGL